MQINKHNILACAEHFAEMLERTMADESREGERRHGSGVALWIWQE